MARIPNTGQVLFPGWIRPGTAGGAVVRAEDVDWQNLITSSQGQSDVRAFFSHHLGSYIQSITGIELTGSHIDLAYRDAAGAEQTAQVDLSFLTTGVSTIDGHSEGWSATRIAVRTLNVTEPAIWVYVGADGTISVGDSGGHVNGSTILSPSGTPWARGCGNDLVSFWTRRSTNETIHYASLDRLNSGEHVQLGGGSILGMACSEDRIWAIKQAGASEVRILSYPVDTNTGVQDPVPTSIVPSFDHSNSFPGTVRIPDDILGMARDGDGHIFVLANAVDDDGTPITYAVAFDEDEGSGYASVSTSDRRFGVHDSVYGGFFTENEDYLVQPHWVTKYEGTTFLSHIDTPESFGSAGYPLIVNTSRDAVEFSRIGATALGDPFTQIASALEMPHESLTEITGLDFSTYEFLIIVVRDSFNRTAHPWLIPYSMLNALSVSAETTIADAGNSAATAAAWLGSHEVPIGVLRRANNGLAIGSIRDYSEPMRISEIGEYSSNNNIPDGHFHLTDIRVPQSAPDYGLLGVSFGDENRAISWFRAHDLISLDHIISFETPQTDSNSMLIASVLGTRDVRLARIRFVDSTDGLAIWASHSGHSPWPLRLFRSWTSNLTDLAIRADVYGLGRR